MLKKSSMKVGTLLNGQADQASQGQIAKREAIDYWDRGSATPSEGNGDRLAHTHTSPSESSALHEVDDISPTSRTRTPWDANGYTMELNSHGHSSPLLPIGRLLESSVEAMSPQSQKHKISGSCSSFASQTSPSTSQSHSRYSSISTNGGAPVTSTWSVASLLQEGSDYPYSTDQYPEHSRNDGLRPPTSMPDVNLSSKSGLLGYPSQSQGNPGALRPTDHMETRNYNIRDTESVIKSHNLSITSCSSSRMHKRNFSESDSAGFSSLNRTIRPSHDHFQPTTPTFPLSQPGSGRIMKSSEISPSPELNPPSNSEVKCMHSTDCDTGSTPRKAISHLFGRNKLCTRMIPSHVWVCLCRKHYQRTRYRNGHEYALYQCDLVIEQIRRIHRWSENESETDLQGWELVMRKREKERCLKLAEKSQQQPQHGDQSEYGKDEHFDSAVLRGNAVPPWLAALCGKKYGTTRLLEIVMDIRKAMLAEKRDQIPDVEFLPMFDLPVGSSTASHKSPTKRSYNTHKRSQSLGVTTHNTSRLSLVDQSFAGQRKRKLGDIGSDFTPNERGVNYNPRFMDRLPIRQPSHKCPPIQERGIGEAGRNMHHKSASEFNSTSRPRGMSFQAIPSTTSYMFPTNPLVAHNITSPTGSERNYFYPVRSTDYTEMAIRTLPPPNAGGLPEQSGPKHSRHWSTPNAALFGRHSLNHQPYDRAGPRRPYEVHSISEDGPLGQQSSFYYTPGQPRQYDTLIHPYNNHEHYRPYDERRDSVYALSKINSHSSCAVGHPNAPSATHLAHQSPEPHQYDNTQEDPSPSGGQPTTGPAKWHPEPYRPHNYGNESEKAEPLYEERR
ncbi:hypothetical protein F4802DRAFT_32369 [Xylaria palmicola]|nr:hypothetical protein F4802DRAFT_32369 [Xylaria palmicola]